MSVETMQDLVTSELKDLYSAEKQATTMYPRLIERTSSQELKLTGLSSTVNKQTLADGEEFDEEEEDDIEDEDFDDEDDEDLEDEDEDEEDEEEEEVGA